MSVARGDSPVVEMPAPGPSAEQDLPALTGADLAAWRRAAGLTQKAVAARFGVEQGTISKAESKGNAALGPAVCRALANVLASERRP